MQSGQLFKSLAQLQVPRKRCGRLLPELLEADFRHAGVAPQMRANIVAEIADLGAVHVQELATSDWTGINSWSQLREMERRRILAACGF